jgi:hypothetical protein
MQTALKTLRIFGNALKAEAPSRLAMKAMKRPNIPEPVRTNHPKAA